MIFKILIIVSVLVSGLVLLYPEEIIQFSKGSTIQESTEKNLVELKEGANKETENIKQIFSEFGEKIQGNFNNLIEPFD